MNFIDDYRVNLKLRNFGLFVSKDEKGRYYIYLCSKTSNSKVLVAKFNGRAAYERGLLMGILSLGSLKPGSMNQLRKTFFNLCSFLRDKEEELNEKVSF